MLSVTSASLISLLFALLEVAPKRGSEVERVIAQQLFVHDERLRICFANYDRNNGLVRYTTIQSVWVVGIIAQGMSVV